MGKKWPRNGEMGSFFHFFHHFWAIFFPVRGVGHFLFSGQIFSLFRVSPRFPFFSRRLTRNHSFHNFVHKNLQWLESQGRAQSKNQSTIDHSKFSTPKSAIKCFFCQFPSPKNLLRLFLGFNLRRQNNNLLRV